MFSKIVSSGVAARDQLVYGNLISNLQTPEEAKEKVFYSDFPVLVSRFGNVEFLAFREVFDIKRKLTFKERFMLACHGSRLSGVREKTAIKLRKNAGVFSARSNAEFERFFDEYYYCVPEIDFFFRWFSGDALLCKAGLDASVGQLEYLNILQYPSFYKGVFENKRLLVISPHVNSIEHQVKNSYAALCNHLGVSSFSVSTIKTFHHVLGGAGDWFVELERLKTEIRNYKDTVDYVILGCGAYGLPLGAYAKGIGLSALHLGGVTQLLFGIMGERWNDMLDAGTSSDFWIRPLASDRPKGAELIEGGCYW